MWKPIIDIGNYHPNLVNNRGSVMFKTPKSGVFELEFLTSGHKTRAVSALNSFQIVPGVSHFDNSFFPL